MLNLAPKSYEDTMRWIFIGLVNDALYILTNPVTTPDEAYFTYRALVHILNQSK